MWKPVLWCLNCNSPANGELSLTQSAQSQGEMCCPQIWNRVVWSHCRILGHTVVLWVPAIFKPLVPVAFQPELCPLWTRGRFGTGEGFGCLFMSQPRLGAAWTCPCSAEPELWSPAQLYQSLLFFRLKVILALQLELAHVWSALEQMCGCLGRWESICPSRGQHLEAACFHLLPSKEQDLF